MNFTIRKMEQSEYGMLRDLTYEAIFQRDENHFISRDVLEQPDIKVFYEAFGKYDDLCLVAEVDKKIVGAVWTRILSGEIKGFGNMDSDTPKFAIALYKEFRGKGIGTALMQRMINCLKENGYKRASLAVQKDNYAVKLYKGVGFSIVKESKEEYVMVCNLR